MNRKTVIFVIIAATLVHSFGQSYGEELETKLAGAKLPSAMYVTTAIYDGSDSVYIFGG
jgi:hypothetical protein